MFSKEATAFGVILFLLPKNFHKLILVQKWKISILIFEFNVYLFFVDLCFQRLATYKSFYSRVSPSEKDRNEKFCKNILING